MNASFVNGSHCCPKIVGKYPIITLWYAVVSSNKNTTLSSCVYSSPIRFHRKYHRDQQTHVHTHACTYKRTHLPDQRDWPSLSPLSLRVCSGLEGTLTKTFLPSLLSFPFCHPPSPPLCLFLCCWVLLTPHPPACTPFCSFRHGPAHPTPHSGASFSTNVRSSGCEGLFPSVCSTFSPFQLNPTISSIYAPLLSNPFGSLDHNC